MRINVKRSASHEHLRLGQCHPAAVLLSLLCNLVLIVALLWRVGAAHRDQAQPWARADSLLLGSGGGSQLGGGGGGAGSGDRLEHAEELLAATQSELGALHDSLNASKQALLALQQQRQTAHGSVSGSSGGGTGGAGGGLPGEQQRQYWLTIGIPTVPRGKGNTTYLTVTLQSLLDELPADASDLLYGAVRIQVMNNAAPGVQHPEFEMLKERALTDSGLFGRKARAYIEWLQNPGTLADPAPDLPEPDDLNNPTNRPGSQVRKQTCDTVTLLRHAAPLSRYFLFMEDDFEVCQYMVRAVQYMLAKANSLPHLQHWVALRFSYGLNGVLIRNDDIPLLADFLWQHITALPPDLLWLEWVLRQRKAGNAGAAPLTLSDRPLPSAQRRPYVIYKYNLMSHLGAISSFAVRPDRPDWPRCYYSMANVWSLNKLERFVPRCLRLTDLSPCPLRLRSQPPPSGPQQQMEPWLEAPLLWPGVAAEGGVKGGTPAAVAAASARLRGIDTAGEGQRQG